MAPKNNPFEIPEGWVLDTRLKRDGTEIKVRCYHEALNHALFFFFFFLAPVKFIQKCYQTLNPNGGFALHKRLELLQRETRDSSVMQQVKNFTHMVRWCTISAMQFLHKFLSFHRISKPTSHRKKLAQRPGRIPHQARAQIHWWLNRARKALILHAQFKSQIQSPALQRPRRSSSENESEESKLPV